MIKRILCHLALIKHRWYYLGNLLKPTNEGDRAATPVGLYQCMHCGECSVGAPSDPAHRTVQP